LELSRGVVQMHDRRPGDFGLIHTKNLSGGSVTGFSGASGSSRRLTGHLLLVPRVGLPVPGKVARFSTSEPVVLSDCVIALRFAEDLDAKVVRDIILKHWDEFAAMYRATCAPYVTVERLRLFLAQRGVCVP
jgi:hypothetical protein